MESAPLVSVVTPFYNAREFFAECIESVLTQTYQNWEYILVDNWSTDGSSQIAEEYAWRYPAKIRLIRTKSFLSQVPNYNFALTCISPKSKYCKMVQADDWIYPECLECMVALAESDSAISMVSSHYLRGNRLTSHVEGHGLPYFETVVPGPEICRLQLLGSLYVFGSPTVPLYKSEIIRSTSRFFDESVLHDDADAHYRSLQTGKFGFVHQVLSFLRLQEDSIRGRVLDFNPNILDRFLQLSKFGPVFFERSELSRELRKVRDEYYRVLARRLLAGAPGTFWQYHISGLKSGGLRLEKKQLLKHTFLESLRRLFNPGSTVAHIYRHILAKSRISSRGSAHIPAPTIPLKEVAVPRRPSDRAV
jgi:glycosyltransferase involved in cell wall biosynthesis